MNQEKLQKLQEKHAKELKDLEFESRFEHLPGFRFINRTDDKSGWVNLSPNTKEEIKQILDEFPATESSFKMAFTGGSADYKVESPYKISSKSNIRQPIDYEVQYVSGNVDIHIDIPEEFLVEFIVRDVRKPSSSEDHYFGGVSRAEMNRTRIPCTKFKGENQNYYGGRYVSKDVETIKEIMSTFLN